MDSPAQVKKWREYAQGISTPKLAFFLYKKDQDASTEAPAHKISRKLFDKISAAVSVRQITGNSIQLLTNESFADVKQRFAIIKSRDAEILPVRDWRECLLLSYPIADQRSNPAY